MTPDPATTDTTTAVLLVAHGSRRQEANRDLTLLAEQIAARGAYPIVEVGYLEVSRPTIPEGGRACVARGAKSIRILPYFLSAGRHVIEDLTAIRDELSAEFPDVDFILCPHLGLHPQMVEIVLDRLSGSESVLGSGVTMQES